VFDFLLFFGVVLCLMLLCLWVMLFVLCVVFDMSVNSKT
jgi:hypothetical protein